MQFPTVMVTAATIAIRCHVWRSSVSATGPIVCPLPSGGIAKAIMRASMTMPAIFGSVESTAALLVLVP